MQSDTRPGKEKQVNIEEMEVSCTGGFNNKHDICKDLITVEGPFSRGILCKTIVNQYSSHKIVFYNVTEITK